MALFLCRPTGSLAQLHLNSALSVPRWLSSILKLMLTLGVLGAIVATVDPAALLASLRSAEWAWVVVAVLLLPLNLALDGWTWKQLLHTILDRVPLKPLAGGVLSGIALGFWTPARVGEYAGRALFLPEGDRWTLSLSVFAQRMVDMAVGVAVGLALLVGALAGGAVPATLPWLLTAAVGGGTLAVLIPFVIAPALVHSGAQWLMPHWTRVAERTAFFQRLTARQRARVLGGTGARYLVFTGQMVCLGAAFAPSAPVGLLWAAAGLTFYVKYLVPSLTVLDLGIREGGAAVFFQLFGLGAADGLNAALLLFTINLLVPALLGAPLVPKLRLSPEVEPVDSRRPAPLSGS